MEKSCLLINLFNKQKEIILKLFISLYLVVIFFNKEYITIMHFKSLNFGDNLNSFILSSIAHSKIKYYNTKKIMQNDSGNIIKLDEIAKTDLFFIGSILANLCDWSFSFQNISNKYKSIITKWYFKIYDYFHPLIIFGSGFIKNDSKTESYVRNLKISYYNKYNLE